MCYASMSMLVCVCVCVCVYGQVQTGVCLHLLLLSAPSALSRLVVIQPEDVTQLFTTVTETDLCAEYSVN